MALQSVISPISTRLVVLETYYSFVPSLEAGSSPVSSSAVPSAMLDLGARCYQRAYQLYREILVIRWWLSIMSDGLEGTSEETTTLSKKISKRSLKRLQVSEAMTSIIGSLQNHRNSWMRQGLSDSMKNYNWVYKPQARVHKYLKPGSIDRPPYFVVIDLKLKTGCDLNSVF